jgi:hypothetical protein
MMRDAKDPHLITRYGGQGEGDGASTYSKNGHKVVVKLWSLGSQPA